MNQQIEIGQQWRRNDERKTIAIIRKVMTDSVQYQLYGVTMTFAIAPRSTKMYGCNEVFLRNNFTLLERKKE